MVAGMVRIKVFHANFESIQSAISCYPFIIADTCTGMQRLSCFRASLMGRGNGHEPSMVKWFLMLILHDFLYGWSIWLYQAGSWGTI